MFDATHAEVRDVIARALAEDIGGGDITSTLCIAADREAEGRFFARQALVVAGIELLPEIFPKVRLAVSSGDEAQPGQELGFVRGKARMLLARERVALNFLQRLSGIATLARQYVEAVKGTRCRILDTRKTTPGLRRLEKMAAAAGGVTNHRMGLFDGVLIKNNHIVAAGGVRAVLESAQPAGLPVEIEVRTETELEEALACRATRLLLDNLTPEQAAAWVKKIDGRATVELSGGITLTNIRAYAESGADFISCGAITHSATAVDINFRLEYEPGKAAPPHAGA